MIAALVMFAAILTEQNDLYTKTADLATFGSNTTGIASRWIPWGTYTDGSGGTEVLRVTSNLVGVVASVFDGYVERDYLPNEVRPEDLGVKYIYIPTPQASNHFEDAGQYLQTTNNTLRLTDALNSSRYLYYSQSGTNYSYSVGSTGGENIETRLAYTYHYPGEFHINSGLAVRFGGERLDAIVRELDGIDPPIGKAWTDALPFRVADLGDWVKTWPTYSALTNDIHFFPLPETGIVHYVTHAFADWTDPGHLYNVWGNDVNDKAYNLTTNAEVKCLPVTMEDVLKIDPGWRYDIPNVETNSSWYVSGSLGGFLLKKYDTGGGGYDTSTLWDNWYDPYPTNYYVEIYLAEYGELSRFDFYIFDAPTGELVYQDDAYADNDADTLYFGEYTANRIPLFANTDDFEHWANGTTRLDWKRLGTICQLERHMETTYRARDDEDYMPFQRTTAARTHVYEGQVEVSFVDEDGQIVAVTNLNPRLASWNLVTQVVECASTNFGWCFPTARLEGAYEIGDLRSSSASGGVDVYAQASLFEGLFESIAAQIVQLNGLRNGQLVVEISGTLTPQGLHALEWQWAFDWCDFYPNDGGDSSSYSYPFSGTEPIAPSTMPTNAVFDLIMSVGKRAATMQTDETAQETTITNLVAYPSTNIWARSWVGMQERPSLEVMIDAKGREFDGYAHEYGDATMDWDDIKTWTNKTRRVFRMSPECAQRGTRTGSDLNRWQMLHSLDAEVKNRFKALAGMDVGQAAQNLANFAAGEENALKNQLIAQRVTVSMTLAPNAPPPPWLVAIAGVNVDDHGQIGGATLYSVFFAYYEGEGTTTRTIEPTGDGYLVGHLSFSVGSSSLTNQVIDTLPVRVDGHQDQMIRTRWRFRNLRDPNL